MNAKQIEFVDTFRGHFCTRPPATVPSLLVNRNKLLPGSELISSRPPTFPAQMLTTNAALGVIKTNSMDASRFITLTTAQVTAAAAKPPDKEQNTRAHNWREIKGCERLLVSCVLQTWTKWGLYLARLLWI